MPRAPGGVSGGTAGDWDNTLGENTLNWDQGAGLAHVAWVNASLNTAVFGGTAGTVTLTDPISVGGLTFLSNSGYTIAAGTEGLTFGAATNQVRMLNVSGTTAGFANGQILSEAADLIEALEAEMDAFEKGANTMTDIADQQEINRLNALVEALVAE